MIGDKGPPVHVGLITDLDDMKTVLERQLWAVDQTRRITNDTGYLRGQSVLLRRLLDELENGVQPL